MATITDDDLKMFQERSKTELASGCDIGSIAWDSVIWDLCNEVRRLRSVSRERGDCAKLREASGNTAALREALKPVKRYLDGYTVNIVELRRTVDAALTAPARNCDRFASTEDAWDAYDEWVESYRAQGKTEPLNEFGWLYAPATEKEGDAK